MTRAHREAEPVPRGVAEGLHLGAHALRLVQPLAGMPQGAFGGRLGGCHRRRSLIRELVGAEVGSDFDGVRGELIGQRRWLAVIGAVGQPRDGIPAASYGLFDDDTGTLTFTRVPYDVDTAARKVRASGLPPVLALRLEQGY